MSQMFPAGLNGPGMHEYVLAEAGLGGRVAACMDSEANGELPFEGGPEAEACGTGPGSGREPQAGLWPSTSTPTRCPPPWAGSRRAGHT